MWVVCGLSVCGLELVVHVWPAWVRCGLSKHGLELVIHVWGLVECVWANWAEPVIRGLNGHMG